MITTKSVLGFVFICAVPACGGGGTNTAAWLGNWSASGTQSTTCEAATTTSQISGIEIIVAGMETPNSIVMTLNSCTIQSDLVGSKAMGGNQACHVNAAGSDVLVTWTQISATLSGSTITGTNTGATDTGCSLTQQYTLKKM